MKSALASAAPAATCADSAFNSASLSAFPRFIQNVMMAMTEPLAAISAPHVRISGISHRLGWDLLLEAARDRAAARNSSWLLGMISLGRLWPFSLDCSFLRSQASQGYDRQDLYQLPPRRRSRLHRSTLRPAAGGV